MGGVSDRCRNLSLNFLMVAKWTRSSMARAVANKLKERRNTGSGGPCRLRFTDADAGSASASSNDRRSWRSLRGRRASSQRVASDSDVRKRHGTQRDCCES